MENKYKYIKEYLGFFCDEEYEQGKNWAKENKDKIDLKFFHIIEKFFEALEIIESSYSYNHAEKIFNDIYKQIDGHKCILDSEILKSLCDIEKYKMSIDKSIYNGNVAKIIKFSTLLQEETAHCHIIIQDDTNLSQSCKEQLFEKLNSYSIFASTINLIGDSYANRWKGGENRVYEVNKSEINNNIHELIDDDNFILGYDLKSHLSSLDKFLDSDNPRELNIENGTITFNYFSIVDFKYKEILKSLIENDIDYTNEQKIQFVTLEGDNDNKWIKPKENNLEDIWSGLKNSFEYTGKYTWNLKNIQLNNYITDDNNKKGPVPIHVTLSYYNMGIFVLSFEIRVQEFFQKSGIKMSLTNYRYLTSLGTNFALSENFYDENFNQKGSFLNNIAESIFSKFEESVKKTEEFTKITSNIIHHDKDDFTPLILSNLYSFSECDEDKLEHMDDLINSFSFKGLILESREVRTCVDNWILHKPEIYENLAPIRYNEDEIIKIDKKQSLVILPDQADWVRAQAVDSIMVAFTIYQLLNLNIKNAKQLFLSTTKSKNTHNNLDNSKLTIDTIDNYKDNIEDLLDVIKEGAITQFPDHERFMEKIFEKLDIETGKSNATKILEKFKTQAEKIIEEAQRKENKRNRVGLTVATSFIGAGALADIFGIINEIKAQEGGFYTYSSLNKNPLDYMLDYLYTFTPISSEIQFMIIVIFTYIVVHFGLKTEEN